MKHSADVAMLAIAVALTMPAACNAPEETDPPAEAEAPLVLSGVFVAEEEPAGGIDEIELRGARYRLLADGCNDVECEEQGRFEHDAARALLRLVPDRSGVPYTLALEVTEAESTDAPESAANADAFAPILGVIGSREHGHAAPTNAQRLLDRNQVRLVRRARLLNRRYARREGGCSAQQIGNAQADCRNRVCAGRQSRGLSYCSGSGGRASYSCACSAGTNGTGTACRRAQSAFLACADRASAQNCYNMIDCRGAFYDATDSLTACSRPTLRGGCAGY